MTHLLIVDDDLKDLRLAYDVARSVGFSDIEGRTNCEQTRQFLDAALLGKCLMPDAIVIDLILGQESGYELLRYCYSNPSLASIPVIVWTNMGEEQRGLCSLFKVRNFVSKDDDTVLRDALQELRESSGAAHQKCA